MIISESKLKGITVLSLTLAVIPFVILLSRSLNTHEVPVHATQCRDCRAVEIFENNQSAGIYFVPPETNVHKLLQSAGWDEISKKDIPLKNGMRLILEDHSGRKNVVVGEMSNATKLSIGLPIDINQATEEELILVKGIGKSTAQSIIALREQINRFQDIRQLMMIRGIKEKKMEEIQHYLYVGK
ncbi:MAG TPA: helix-hairpin-helix domain-containing protein [Smithella sp.]|mgnify:FL=1|nr:helix-hairpin-helix domain-containing protein [Smithella sp.]